MLSKCLTYFSYSCNSRTDTNLFIQRSWCTPSSCAHEYVYCGGLHLRMPRIPVGAVNCCIKRTKTPTEPDSTAVFPNDALSKNKNSRSQRFFACQVPVRFNCFTCLLTIDLPLRKDSKWPIIMILIHQKPRKAHSRLDIQTVIAENCRNRQYHLYLYTTWFVVA